MTNPQSLNRYAYVLNNPATLTDPQGLKIPWDEPRGADLYAGGGLGGAWGSCTIDGLDSSCSLAYAALQGGGAVQCPKNDCGHINDQGVLKEFYAFGDGTSGYYIPGQAPQQSTLAAELLWISQLVSWNNSSGLPDAVIVALIWKESGFNLLALNDEGGGFGAIGLMQVRQIGLDDFNQTWEPFGAWYSKGDLYDPILNVYIGSAEVYNDVFRYNNGNVVAGLDWYGTGPGYGQSILNIAGSIPAQGIGALK